jgi:hypothetical protein
VHLVGPVVLLCCNARSKSLSITQQNNSYIFRKNEQKEEMLCSATENKITNTGQNYYTFTS